MEPEQADRARAQEVEGEGAGNRERGTMTHERWRMGKKVSCRRCGREDTEAGAGRRSLDDACVGSAGGMALARATGNGHHLWREFLFSEAEFITKGATMLEASRVPRSVVAAEVHDGGGCCAGGVCSRGLPLRHAEVAEGPWQRDPDWLYLPHLKEEKQREAALEENVGIVARQGRGGT